MSIIISQGELCEIVKKRKLETIEKSEEPDQTDGKGIDESLNKLIMENEAQKFIELFKKPFQKRQNKLIVRTAQYKTLHQKLKIKEKIESEVKSSTGLKLLRFLFIFVESLTKKDKNDGKNKSSNPAETYKH